MGWVEAVFHSGRRCGLGVAWDARMAEAGIISQEAGQDLAAVAEDSVVLAVAALVVVVPAVVGKTGVWSLRFESGKTPASRVHA